MTRRVVRVAGATVALAVALGAAACGGDDRRAESSGSFLALSYNVAGLPQGISSSDPERNLPLISPLLEPYDVVLTQEDFDWWDPILDGFSFARFHEQLRAKATHEHRTGRHPGPEAVGLDLSGGREPPAVGDGLGVLSRLPFRDVVRVPWGSCFGGATDGAGDCLAMKGFLAATLEVAPGVEVDLYDLHAEAGGGPEDQAARAAGFAQLATYLAARSPPGRAVVLGGDTNLHTTARTAGPEDAADAGVWATFLAATGLTDVCDALACADDGAIDKFAYRSGATVAVEATSHAFERARFVTPEGAPLSDHDALAVRFAWSAKGVSPL